jgi:hypothetical protein
MNALRDLLGKFSELSIPALQADNPFEELPIDEASRRAKQREEAVGAYNTFYRDYAIKYGQFKRIGFVFLILALILVILSAHQFQLTPIHKTLAACGMYLALLVAVGFLRADIAPSPDAVLSIDYIGKHYTKLRHQHLLELAEPTVYWVNPDRPPGRFQFRLTTRLWVSGYKFLFAATDPDQHFVYFASYGSVNSRTRFLHYIDARPPRFECELGNFDYGDIADPKPEIRIHLWVFVPFPSSWAASIQNPTAQHDGLVVQGPGGQRGFVLGALGASLGSFDNHTTFSRTRGPFGWSWWHVHADENADRVLHEFINELPWTLGVVTVQYPRGRRLVAGP